MFPAVFSRHAAAYRDRLEEVMDRGEATGRLRVIELIGARPGMRVLDLACGPGTLTRRLAALVGPQGSVVGVDLAEGMIAIARSAPLTNVQYELMDMERLRFRNESFDVVTCGHGLQFASDLGSVLREGRRVLRPGGRLAASVPVSPRRQRVWEVIDEVVERRLPPAPRPSDNAAARAVVADPAALKAAALHAGFVSADVEVIVEHIQWPSAEEFVARLTSWWDCAARLESASAQARDELTAEATTALRREFPAGIQTEGRNHVLVATA